MRTAILFAPSARDSRPPEAPSDDDAPGTAPEAEAPPRRDATSWLARALEPWGYKVVLAVGPSAPGELHRALAEVGEGDAVLVHVSGKVEAATELALGDGDTMSLAEIAGRVGSSGASSALVVAELLLGETRDDALALAEDVADIRSAFAGAKFPALVALHGTAEPGERLPFSRLVVRATTDLVTEGGEEVRAYDVVERLREMPESHAVAKSYTFVRGEDDFELAVPSDAMLDAPDLEALTLLADLARDRGQVHLAIAGYRAALLASPGEELSHGALYASLAASEEAAGRAGRARRAYRKALAANPSDRSARDALIRLDGDAGDWARAKEGMIARLPLLASDAERSDELFAIARLTVEKLRDVAAAVVHLEEARRLDPDSEDILEALRRSYRVLKRWTDLIEVTGLLAERAPTHTERAARHFAQAHIARKQMDDADLAVGYLLRALEADPTHDEALDVLCELRAALGEEKDLHKDLHRVLEALLDMPDEEVRAGDVARRMSALKTPPARRADATQEITPDQIEEPEDDDEAVLTELESQVERAPLASKGYAALFGMHSRAGHADRAYLAAQALEELGAADAEAQAVLEETRPSGLRVRASFDAEAFRLLRAPGSDEVLEALIRAIGRAAGVVRHEERRAKKRLVVLDEARKQSATSTASIVRTFHWASDILDVACPDLYILDRVPGDVIAVPGTERQTALGPAVLTGLSTIDLAFLCGRHLTYYRPEYSALIDYPTLNELSLLVLSALQLALPAMPVPASVEAVVSALRNGLKRHLTADEREAMSVAVAKLDARGGRVNLQAWIRSVELTATRVGLLLCGDLRAAMTRIRSEQRTIAEVSDESKRIDLLSFCATGNLAALRERVAAPTTLRPPRDSGLMGKVLALPIEWSESPEQEGVAS